MRLKSIALGQMARYMSGNNEENHYHTTTPTVKHGGGNNLMVWGCMGQNRVEKLLEIQGKINAKQYCEILEDGIEESWR